MVKRMILEKNDTWNSSWYSELLNNNSKSKSIAQTDNKKTNVAVMLDLQRTSDNIDDEKAKLFIKYLDFIRKKFNAEIATISISTHNNYYNYYDSMIEVLDILSNNLIENIVIDKSFYLGGIYDYDKDEEYSSNDSRFNSNKEQTFEEYIGSHYNNKWFCLIDDNVKLDEFLKFQNNKPMLLIAPSQNESMKESSNNLMRKTIKTRGFDGVLECLEKYVNEIAKYSEEEILKMQQNMIYHMSWFDLSEKIKNKNLKFIERYLNEGYAEDEDYGMIDLFLRTYINDNYSDEEGEYIKRIKDYINKVESSMTKKLD